MAAALPDGSREVCPLQKDRREKIEYWLFPAVFTTVSIAGPGDETQLAAMLLVVDREVSKLTVFFGVSIARIVASGTGVGGRAYFAIWQ